MNNITQHSAVTPPIEDHRIVLISESVPRINLILCKLITVYMVSSNWSFRDLIPNDLGQVLFMVTSPSGGHVVVGWPVNYYFHHYAIHSMRSPY